MIFNSDHPSRYGENSLYLTSESTRSGSSPRTRGKPCVLRHTHLFNGITPAGAGKTHIRKKCAWKVWDHPRRCGENPDIVLTDSFAKGSPPQVRGKPAQRDSLGSCARITPAGAGKTDLCGCKFCATWDHPRRCGENYPLG